MRALLRCNAEGRNTDVRFAAPSQHATGPVSPPQGGECEVIGVARHSETLEPLVVYWPIHDQTGWWVRPHEMFFESVMVDGVSRARFEWVGDA